MYCTSDIERFLSRIEISVPSGCWLWTDVLSSNGYATFGSKTDKSHGPAHRFSYKLFRGPILEETLDHLCRIRHCVNPWHLEAVSLKENIRRAPGSNASKTHCVNGHEFTLENTLIRHGARDGQRICRECNQAMNRRWQAKQEKKERLKQTHCMHGHEFDVVNTYIRDNGSRQCKECKSIRDKKYKAQRKERNAN